ncbi:MAG: arylesterase, partial [Beijerinckiaceae bacterium]
MSCLGYGALRQARNVALAIFSLSSSVFAEPVTIVALGDSLTAGFGLEDQADGFVPQLEAWLKAENVDV